MDVIWLHSMGIKIYTNLFDFRSSKITRNQPKAVQTGKGRDLVADAHVRTTVNVKRLLYKTLNSFIKRVKQLHYERLVLLLYKSSCNVITNKLD